MADGNKDSRRRFGRRGRDRSERKEEQKPKLPDLPALTCGICEKQIFDLSSALTDRGGGDPVHFDCALSKAATGESLGPDEKVAYIGHGSFAVIQFKDKTQTTFIIKRRIEWERDGNKLEWRKVMQRRMGI
ncbi:MAG TPA: hypothetical protein PLC54_08140 [Spirochaetales bacterium]|nr:hypothetical protein [Spirochaetales bacterium]